MRKCLISAVAIGALFAVGTTVHGQTVVNDKFNAGYSTQVDGDINYAAGMDTGWGSANLTTSAYYIGMGPSSDTGTYWNFGNNVSNLANSANSSLTGIGVSINTTAGTYVAPNDGTGSPGTTPRTSVANSMGSSLGGASYTDTISLTGLADNAPYSLYIIGTIYKYNNAPFATMTAAITVGTGVADGGINTMTPTSSNSNLAFTEGQTYVLFTGTTSATGTLTATVTAGTGGGDGVSAVQLIQGSAVPVPEPASLGLLSFAGLGLLARRRK